MGDRIGAAGWARFKAVIKDAHDTWNKAQITWQRFAPTTVPLYNEGQNEAYTNITLLALVGFNEFRTWPITDKKNSGELDNQNMIMLLNREYLGEQGLLNADGYFEFNSGKDYFIHMGIKYKAEGDTGLSQDQADPLLIQIVLRREEKLT